LFFPIFIGNVDRFTVMFMGILFVGIIDVMMIPMLSYMYEVSLRSDTHLLFFILPILLIVVNSLAILQYFSYRKWKKTGGDEFDWK